MFEVTVTLNSNLHVAPPFDVNGFVPYADCPLAVTPKARWDEHDKTWAIVSDAWQITHRRSGFNLGGSTFPSREAAVTVLVACDPKFPAWPVATGARMDVATIACRGKFRLAMQPQGAPCS